MKQNDPIRVKKATTRLIAALLAALVLLAVSGFGIFKMLGTPKSLTADYSDMSYDVEGSAEPEPVKTGAQVGDFVEHEVNLILKNFAEGTRGGTVRERYAVVPVQGKLVAFRFPQRWLESEQAIVDATQDLLNGVGQYIDKYIVVRGTVQALPEAVSGELYSWFADNQEWMQQGGLISSEQDAAASLADYMVSVDTVGKLPFGAVVGLTAAAGLCLLYALYELIRILAKGYAVQQTEAEADSVESIESETDSEAEDGIEVEITEADPETGEDVTDLEVEIVEEETDNADA